MAIMKMDGVYLSDEKQKGGGTLWSLPNQENLVIKIINKRDKFKKGQAAVVTTAGITSIASLFQHASTQMENDHTDSKTKEFVYDPDRELIVDINDGNVVRIAYPGSQTTKAEGLTVDQYKALAPHEQDGYKWNADANLYVK